MGTAPTGSRHPRGLGTHGVSARGCRDNHPASTFQVVFVLFSLCITSYYHRFAPAICLTHQHVFSITLSSFASAQCLRLLSWDKAVRCDEGRHRQTDRQTDTHLQCWAGASTPAEQTALPTHTYTLSAWLDQGKRTQVSIVFLELSLSCRLRGLTVRLFGPVALEITHKSFLFQTQLVVRKHISILSYGLLGSRELSVPVVMITREMHNGMSKQFNLIHTCITTALAVAMRHNEHSTLPAYTGVLRFK